ncbi:hypothetical protein NMYAN_110017 [Nitrosomonas nitrosa]|uniref:Uncharacterized protein n=1 Tax=Nitrosomonas nitrosa TaxID=52442 RepID=A0A8H8YZN3_9PROT|nr:hypothetical protein NMYAN_110017 [Nitrosomonas nitrosa]
MMLLLRSRLLQIIVCGMKQVRFLLCLLMNVLQALELLRLWRLLRILILWEAVLLMEAMVFTMLLRILIRL